MGELSDRFGALMARMAQTDADLFRTIGAQNAEFRELLDEVVPPEKGVTQATAPSSPALTPQSLLPPDACSEKGLKARFKTITPAVAFLEEQIGPPPTKRLTWALISQAFLQGSWPQKASPSKPRGATVTLSDLQALEARLLARIELMEERILARLGL